MPDIEYVFSDLYLCREAGCDATVRTFHEPTDPTVFHRSARGESRTSTHVRERAVSWTHPPD
jgi:hypothetical protein